jgi:hypothetical protein
MKPKGKLSRARLRTTGKEGYHIRETVDDSHKFGTSKEKEYACLGAHVWVFVLCICVCI